jgi:hypothetical protein
VVEAPSCLYVRPAGKNQQPWNNAFAYWLENASRIEARLVYSRSLKGFRTHTGYCEAQVKVDRLFSHPWCLGLP